MAKRLAQSLDAELVLLTVFDPTSNLQLAEDLRRNADHWLTGLLRDRSCPGRSRVEQGSPVRSILQVIEEEEADLVVISSHGQAGFPDMAMGSVVRDVIKASKVPVTVVGPASS